MIDPTLLNPWPGAYSVLRFGNYAPWLGIQSTLLTPAQPLWQPFWVNYYPFHRELL